MTGLRYSSETDENPTGPLCYVWYNMQVREEKNRGDLSALTARGLMGSVLEKTVSVGIYKMNWSQRGK